MNLSEPLEGLMSAVQAAVLRVLTRADVGFSGRQVHALAGVGSTSSVHRALAGFVDMGLVTAEPHPPAISYRANREHVLWPVIELALDARARVFTSIQEFCESEFSRVIGLTVVVYGSVARRESSLSSDIDLFVVYPDGVDEDLRADVGYRLASHAQQITGNDAQIYSVERSDLAQRVADADPLVTNVLTDGIHLFGPRLPKVSGRAA